MNFIRSVPMATAGIALALAALGNLLVPSFMGTNDLGALVPRDGILTLRIIIGAVALFILVIFTLKIILDFNHAKREWHVHVPLSVLPTATMALILLSSYLISFRPINAPNSGAAVFALIVWFLAIALQLFVMGLFYYRFLIKKPANGPKPDCTLGSRLKSVFPSWFIIGVGIVVVSVTAPVMGRAFVAAGAENGMNIALTIGRAAFYLGFVLYFPTLIAVIYRMIKVKIFPEPLKKTIAIFAAPMALLVVGYLNAFGGLTPSPHSTFSPAFLYFMLSLAFVIFIYVLVMMLSLIRIKFYPTYAAFTFPLVISAMAFRLSTNFIQSQLEGAGGHFFVQLLNTFSHFALWLSVAAVLFVIFHYIKYFCYWLTFTRKTKPLPMTIVK